jgi:hypothetical protein
MKRHMDPTPAAPPPEPARGSKPSLRERFKGLIAESGAIVLWVYFGIFGLVLLGTATAIKFGIKVEGVSFAAGTWAAAYLFTKLTQPLRIAATLAITPAIATFLRRFRKPAAGGVPVGGVPASAEPTSAVPASAVPAPPAAPGASVSDASMARGQGEK